MKKTLLMIITSATMLVAAPQDMPNNAVEGVTAPAKGMGMPQCRQMMGRDGMRQNRGMQGFSLIQPGLPHLGRMLLPYLDNPAFGLSAEQKTALAKTREETQGTLGKLIPQINTLQEEIRSAGIAGTAVETLKPKVEKLAALKSEATMAQLNCLEKTKNILTKDQMFFLLTQKNRHGNRTIMRQWRMQRPMGKNRP